MTLIINPETGGLVRITHRIDKYLVKGDDGKTYVPCPHCGFINCVEDPEVVRFLEKEAEDL